MSAGTPAGGGLTRRMVALFMVCALVPLGAALLIAYGGVYEVLVGQRVATLRGVATSHGMAVVERLDLADTLARVIADDIDSGRTARVRSMAKYFSAAVVVDDDTQPRALHGRPAGAPTAGSLDAYDERFATGASVLVIEPLVDAPRVWIVRALASEGAPRRLALALDPGFIWSDDELPYQTDVCILAADRRPLNCSAALWPLAGRALRSGPIGPIGEFTWDEGGQRYLSGYHEVFLRGRYGADSWFVVAAQPASVALAPADALGWLGVPVVALGVLIAALLGFTQVRRTLRPLRELTHATARIAARDFSAPLPEHSKDEFGTLAGAFNTMSRRLGQQFSALQAQSEIDGVILSRADLDEVGAIVLKRLAGMVSAERYWLVLRAAGSNENFTVFGSGQSAGAERPTVVIAEHERRRLRGTSVGTPVLSALGERHVFVQPIVLAGEFGGVLALGYNEPRQPGEDERAVLRELADRVAVALFSARRDEEVYRHANYDGLTGLPNRLLGTELLSRAVASASRDSNQLAVLFTDLDGFAAVNASTGHAAGDQVLEQAAMRLRHCLRKSDLVARLGGDEFMLVLTEIRDPGDAALVARNVIDALSRPYALSGEDVFVSASVGIAVYPSDGASPEELLRHADLAMYKAKQGGRRQLAFFEASMNEDVRGRAERAGDLRRALQTGQFELHYQPQLDLKSGAVVGAEALIRWMHPVRGLVPPGHFISFAESGGLIEEIGRWTLGAAAAQFVSWQNAGLAIEHLSVNVSPRQLDKPGFAQIVGDILRRTQMPAAALHLELTESSMLDNSGATAANIAALVDQGVMLELDDFGTGYSALAHLQRLPITVVKLDRAFIRTIESSAGTQSFVKAAIDMVHALGKIVIAEGVEHPGQKAVLGQLGCDLMQGYLLSRALPAVPFTDFVLAHRAAPSRTSPPTLAAIPKPNR